MKALALVCMVGLAGCASTSGVFEVSPGTYKTSATAAATAGGLARAKGAAYKQAQVKCSTLGRQMALMDQAESDKVTHGSVELTFTCN